MTTHDDQDLQKFLDGDSDYRRAYRALPKTQPPAALDDAILAAARAEIKRNARPAWLVPLSLAATIVLGVGLSVRQLTPPTAHLPEHMLVSDGPATVASDALAPVAKSLERAASVPRDDTSVSAPDAQAQASANAERERRAEVVARERPAQQSVPIKGGRYKTIAAAPPAPAPDVSAPPPPATTVPMASRPAPAPAARAQPLEESASVPAPAVTDEQDARRAGLASMSDETLHSRPYVAAPSADTQRDTDQQVVIVTGNRLDVYAKAEPTPDERLEEIRALHKAGRDREARRLFDEFLEDWPDHELPKTFPYQRR